MVEVPLAECTYVACAFVWPGSSDSQMRTVGAPKMRTGHERDTCGLVTG